MKRKGSIQPVLIVGAVLIIGLIVFGLSKFGVLDRDTVKDETPPVTDVVEKEEDEEKIIDDVVLEDDQDNDDDIAIGKLSPDFTLKNLNDEEVTLSDYKGKIVMINFWASWCVYCDMEMPDIQKISEENDDLVVLAVNVREDKKTVEKYIEEGGYDFEVVLDEDGKVSMDYLVSGLPTSYFVDKDGILLGGVPRYMTYEEIDGILENIRENE